MARHCNPDYGKTLQTRRWQDIAIVKMANMVILTKAKHSEGRAGRAGREKGWGYRCEKGAR